MGQTRTFSDPIVLSVCAKKENSNIPTTNTTTSSTKTRLIDGCLIKLKEQLKSIAAEHNIKYSTILSEKALKQMASLMPKSREEMLKKIIEMTTIKYDMYKFDRLLSITSLFRSKLNEENENDGNNYSLKRKRDMPTSTTSSYFQDKTNGYYKKKK